MSDVPSLLRRSAVALVAALVFGASDARAGATFTIVNQDPAGVGFNDPTPAVPVGGNPGTTVGQQRLNAFNYAANTLWGSRLTSAVPIVVGASFGPLQCDAFSGTLGSAGPSNFKKYAAANPNVPANTWVAIALGEKIQGVDSNAGAPDIDANFNGDIGKPGCLQGSGWYYGFDANPPAGKTDFVSVLLHELGHGLGFLTLVDSATGEKANGFNDVFMLNLLDITTQKTWPAMTNAERLTSQVNENKVVWTGASTTAGSGVVTAGKDGSGRVMVFTPNPLQDGSSVSHWNQDYNCNTCIDLQPVDLMKPAYTVPTHTTLVTHLAFKDMGWGDVGSGAGNTAPGITAGGAVSRQQASAGTVATIATVNDAETAAGSLVVTVIAGGTATGVTLTGITNTAGAVTAIVSASCTATGGTVRLQVTDGGALTATANLTVNVTANTAPTLGTYADAAATLAGAQTVTPTSAPADNGSVATLTVLSGTFTGTANANKTTGVVSITNAGPVGTHTFTVTATDDCGSVATRTFALQVTGGGGGCSPDTTPPSVLAPNPTSINVNQSACAGGVGVATLGTVQARDAALGAQLNAFLSTAATATDACSAATRLATRLGAVDIVSTTPFALGANAVTFRFADASSNVGTATGSVFVRRQGDVDLSGGVDVFDVVTIQNLIVGNVAAGVAPFNSPTSRVADNDNSGIVDVFDVILEANFIVGNSTCLTP